MSRATKVENIKQALIYLSREADKEGFSQIMISINVMIKDIETWQTAYTMKKVSSKDFNSFLYDQNIWIREKLHLDFIKNYSKVRTN